MPPKKKSGKKKSERLAGDPITVGGGGGRRIKGRLTLNPVYIEFSNYYEDQDPNGKKKKKFFKHKTSEMKSLILWVDGAKTNLSYLIPKPAVGECKVTISCDNSDKELLMFSSKNRIKLHTREYPPEESGTRHESLDKANFINRVRVKNNNGGSFDSGTLTANQMVEVEANTIVV
jgi:hypothetical protein